MEVKVVAVLTVKRTYFLDCPYGRCFSEDHRFTTSEFDTVEEAWCALFKHIREKHEREIDSKDRDV